jgi:hypothetical protein
VIYAEPERSRGRSFHGLLAYIVHDVGKTTAERVLFAEPINVALGIGSTADEMQDATARSLRMRKRGQKPDRLAFHFVLSWHPDDRPTLAHMSATAREALSALGLSEHQALVVGHDDNGKPHVHVMANVLHPVTGKAAKLGWRYRTMSRWAADYEKRQGIIRCTRRNVAKAANENRMRIPRAAWSIAEPKKQKADMQPALRP